MRQVCGNDMARAEEPSLLQRPYAVDRHGGISSLLTQSGLPLLASLYSLKSATTIVPTDMFSRSSMMVGV